VTRKKTGKKPRGIKGHNFPSFAPRKTGFKKEKGEKKKKATTNKKTSTIGIGPAILLPIVQR